MWDYRSKVLAVTAVLVTASLGASAYYALTQPEPLRPARADDVIIRILLDRTNLTLGVTEANATVTVTNIRDFKLSLGYEYYLSYTHTANSSLVREFRNQYFDSPYIARPGYVEPVVQDRLNETSLYALFGVSDRYSLLGTYRIDFRFSSDLAAPPAYFTVST